MGNVSQDVKSTRFDPCVRARLFTGIVIGTLALAIGANVAIFTVTDAAMLRPFSYPQIDRMVVSGREDARGQIMSVAWPDFQDWLTQNQAFEYLGIYRGAAVNLTTGGQPERLNGAMVSSGVFGAAGIPPMAGRTLLLEDDGPGAGRGRRHQ